MAPRRWVTGSNLTNPGVVLVCPRCARPRRILGAVTEPAAVRRLLAALGARRPSRRRGGPPHRLTRSPRRSAPAPAVRRLGEAPGPIRADPGHPLPQDTPCRPAGDALSFRRAAGGVVDAASGGSGRGGRDTDTSLGLTRFLRFTLAALFRSRQDARRWTARALPLESSTPDSATRRSPSADTGRLGRSAVTSTGCSRNSRSRHAPRDPLQALPDHADAGAP